MKNISVTLLLCILVGCESQNVETTCQLPNMAAAVSGISITQGVYGLVTFTEGNCMPGMGSSGSCKTCPVKRTVRFYEYTLPQDAVPSGVAGFYTSFRTRLVAQAESDLTGVFQVSLPQGTYSMVVVEDGKLYANGGDGQGGIHPVTVEQGTKRQDFAITYKAVY